MWKRNILVNYRCTMKHRIVEAVSGLVVYEKERVEDSKRVRTRRFMVSSSSLIIKPTQSHNSTVSPRFLNWVFSATTSTKKQKKSLFCFFICFSSTTFWGLFHSCSLSFFLFFSDCFFGYPLISGLWYVLFLLCPWESCNLSSFLVCGKW